MKLKTKLVGGFIICALITLLAGGVGYLYIGQLRDHIHEIVAEQLPALAAVTEATVSLEELAAALNQAANPVLDTDEFKEMQSRIEEKRAEYRKAQEAYASTARSSEEEAVWQEYLTAVAKWRETNVAATAKVNEFEGRGLRNMTGMLKSENPAQAVAAFSEMHDSLLARSEKQGAETIALLRRLAQLKGQTLAQDAKIAEEEAARARAITLGAVFVGFVIALCLGIALAMSIVKPVNVLTEASSVLAAKNEEMAHAAAAIADGDLTRDVRAEDESTKLALSGQAGDDELGQLMRAFGAMAGHQRTLGGAMAKMSENLNKVLYGINESIAQVASGSQQVSDASQSLSQGATEQAASLEEISSSMTEVGSQTKTNAENAAQANRLAGLARGAAGDGAQKMQEMMSAMSDIQNSSRDIVKIVKVIDDIAFQTNLLALNAAVEAARAGRHGKGFAVVAEEVRNLAARSAKAARETAEGISSSMQKIENGTKVAEVTVEALVQIEEQVTKVNDLVAEIAAASNEQAQAISQVSQGMGQIDSVTQQNTANAEETASAAEELSSQATELRDLVAQFKLRSSGEGKSWGGAAKVSAKQQHKSHSAARAQTGGREWGKTAKKADSPEYVIALDDKDFGKY